MKRHLYPLLLMLLAASLLTSDTATSSTQQDSREKNSSNFSYSPVTTIQKPKSSVSQKSTVGTSAQAMP